MGQIVGKNGRPGKIGCLRAGGQKKGCFWGVLGPWKWAKIRNIVVKTGETVIKNLTF